VPHADYNAARLPDDVDAVAAAALGCRYATAYHALAHRADLSAGERVVVVGCGGLGLSAVQVADALGATPIAVDVRAAALDRAEDLGAVAAVNADGVTDVPGAVHEIAGGGVEVSLDALGSEETCRAAVESLDTRGVHVQAGLTGAAERGEIPLPTDEMTRWERTFVGARGLPPSRYGELLRLVADGRLDPGALVTRRVGLDDVTERLAAMSEYRTEGVEVVTDL
jgi:alcohol dehydrogenase